MCKLKNKGVIRTNFIYFIDFVNVLVKIVS